MIRYLDVADAKQATGLRLVCTQGVPSPWGLAARACFKLRGVEFVLVRQLATQGNEALLEWTRHRNAPIAIYNDEPPRVRWYEIVQLAERLGRGASLIPRDINDRMKMVGFVSEMADPYGFAWNARLLSMKSIHQSGGDDALENPIFSQYGYSREAAEKALTRVHEFLEVLAGLIKSQKAEGSSFLFGHELTAADVYWAYFSLMLDAMTEEKNPVPPHVKEHNDILAAMIGDYDPILISFREKIFDKHLDVPIEY